MKQPWWHQELEALVPQLRAMVRRRLPAGSADVEDVLNEAVLAVTQRMSAGQSSGALDLTREPQSDGDRVAFHKLVHVIARRRVCDFYRRLDREASNLAADATEGIAAPGPLADRQLMIRRMLGIVSAALGDFSAEDRDLIALAGYGSDAPFRLSSRERQRLSRARKRLREAITSNLGADALQLLRRDGGSNGLPA